MSDVPGPGPLRMLTLDFDGVICSPFFGRNLGLHRGFLDPAAPAPRARVWPRALADPWDHARYDLRSALPEVAGALARLSATRRLVVLTGRRSSPAGWLHRHGLDGYIDTVVFNEGPLRSPHFKLRAVETLGALEHVDDDPRTAQLLAQASRTVVFLRNWPRNRGLEFATTVTRVRDLEDVAARLEAAADHEA